MKQINNIYSPHHNNIDMSRLPKHVAIIMDGNGRWAEQRGLPRALGHREGAKKVREIVEVSGQMGIHALTLYAFSEENWSRPQDEVSALMELLQDYLEEEKENLNKNNVKFKVIGNVDKIPSKTQKTLIDVQEYLSKNTGLILTVALSYGGRSELIDSCKKIATSIADGSLKPEEINKDVIESSLNTHGLPDLDLMIRTSGEQRISNFLLWQVAYAELYFTPVYWPDFGKIDFEKALIDYQSRDRRFGKIALNTQTNTNKEACL